MLNTINVRFKKLDESAKEPKYSSEFAAGADLFTSSKEEITFEPNETKFIHTGIALEIPEGFVGLVYARSGLASKRGLAPANKVGVIDSDYRGEIIVTLHNHSSVMQKIEPFERIAQIVFTPYYKAEFELSDNLDDTKRGTGGFGSTGNK